MSFGEQLKKMRKNAGLTVRALAEKAGVSFTQISAWETGANSGMTLRNAEKLANALNVSIGDFYPDQNKFDLSRTVTEFLESPQAIELRLSNSEIKWLYSQADAFWRSLEVNDAPSSGIIAHLVRIRRVVRDAQTWKIMSDAIQDFLGSTYAKIMKPTASEIEWLETMTEENWNSLSADQPSPESIANVLFLKR